MHSRVQSLRAGRREPGGERSVMQVLADVLSNLEDLLSARIRLAQAQARAELRAFRPAAAVIMVGVLGGVVSALFLLLAAVAALSMLMSVWLAALIVGLGMGVVCAVLLGMGAKLLRRRAATIGAEPVVAERVKERAPWTGQPSA